MNLSTNERRTMSALSRHLRNARDVVETEVGKDVFDVRAFNTYLQFWVKYNTVIPKMIKKMGGRIRSCWLLGMTDREFDLFLRNEFKEEYKKLDPETIEREQSVCKVAQDFFPIPQQTLFNASNEK